MTPRLLSDALAVDRIVQLVVEDEITRPLREAVERRWPGGKASYLVGCQACVGVWAGLAVSSGLIPRRVIWALALSSAVLAAHRAEDRVSAVATARVRKLRTG